jgi:hypothetical protein
VHNGEKNDQLTKDGLHVVLGLLGHVAAGDCWFDYPTQNVHTPWEMVRTKELEIVQVLIVVVHRERQGWEHVKDETREDVVTSDVDETVRLILLTWCHERQGDIDAPDNVKEKLQLSGVLVKDIVDIVSLARSVGNEHNSDKKGEHEDYLPQEVQSARIGVLNDQVSLAPVALPLKLLLWATVELVLKVILLEEKLHKVFVSITMQKKAFRQSFLKIWLI